MIIEWSKTFDKWLSKIKDKRTQFDILSRLRKIEIDNYLGDSKSVGDGVYELRFHFGSGYRIYFTYKDEKIILLLCGGDKSTQQQDIKKAKEML